MDPRVSCKIFKTDLTYSLTFIEIDAESVWLFLSFFNKYLYNLL